MSLEAEPGIGGRHTLSVVDDLYPGLSPAVHVEQDVGGPGIDAVLEEFFDYGSRALHHLARCDLVRYAIGQQVDNIVHACVRTISRGGGR